MSKYSTHCLLPVSALQKQGRQREKEQRAVVHLDSSASLPVRDVSVLPRIVEPSAPKGTTSSSKMRPPTIRSLRKPKQIVLPSQASGFKRRTLSEQLSAISNSMASFSQSLPTSFGKHAASSKGVLLEAPTLSLRVGRLESLCSYPVSFKNDVCEYCFDHPFEKAIDMVMHYRDMEDVHCSQEGAKVTFRFRIPSILLGFTSTICRVVSVRL
mmetsp:Transcript_42071/g.108277  ORF Transcript_42071/g.108277 Transcript_42071/m.108277 type:complete len:212 (+) Transcript_42071:118-753(+)